MVASSSNLLLVASTPHGHHVHTNSTIPNDHDLTMTNFSTENHGYMIRSTSTNNISGSTGNLKDMIMLETVAPMAFAAAAATSAPASSTTPTTKKSSTVGEEKQRPRPRRKKMVSIGVDTMKKMMMTSSSNSTAVVVAIPESPTLVSRKHEREQRDDMEDMLNIRSVFNRKVLAFDMSTPAMPDMMPDMIPALPTPAMNRSSKIQNERSNNDAPPPMKKQMKKKQLHMGRRLRQIKKRLSSKSSSKEEEEQEAAEEDDGHLSQGTSTTTSTSSLGQTASSQEADEEDTEAPLIIDTMSMITTLKPRVRSMFEEGEEDLMMMPLMPSMPLPAAPWSSPSPTSAYDGDRDAVVNDTADDWGVFASIQDDDEEEEEHDSEPGYNFNYKSKSSSRSSFTKISTNPCFIPRAHLPNFAATAGSE